MSTAIEEAVKAGHEVRLIPPPPLRGKLTPKGPNEGISTRNRELHAILVEKAQQAAEHPWWEENPDVFDGL